MTGTDERYTCDECGGEGVIITCCDDICVGLGYCIHGDGEDICPKCDGDGAIDPVFLYEEYADEQGGTPRPSQLATEDDAAVSANAELVATAIATFLVEEGALSIGDQIVAIRQQYALAWRAALVRAGFDDCAGMAALDIAEGVDLALSRLLDAAQEEYADDVVAPRPSQFAIHEEAQP